MVNHELCIQKSTKGFWRSIRRKEVCWWILHYQEVVCGPEWGILDSFLELPNIEHVSKPLHTAPQCPRIHLTRWSLWLGAYVESQPGRCPGWAWGGGLDPPKIERCSISSHTAPKGPKIHLVWYEFWLNSFGQVSACGVVWVSMGRLVWSVVDSRQR